MSKITATINMNTSKTLLTELHYLGPLPYYAQWLCYETICLEQWEHYQKGSFRNRCYLASANGKVSLSIPLLRGKHQQAPIRTVAVDNSRPWQLQHWRSIQTAYGNSPFFEYYKDAFQALYERPYTLLFDFCLDVQELVLSCLQWSPNLSFSTAYKTDLPTDWQDARNQLRPKQYPNFPLSNYQVVPYPQVFEDRQGFIPHLSILDLLFCTGPESLSYLQQMLTE